MGARETISQPMQWPLVSRSHERTDNVSSWLDLVQNELNSEFLEKARAEEAEGRSPADFLLEQKALSSRTILGALSRHYQLPALDVENYQPDEKSLARLTEEQIRQFTMLPLFEIEDHLYVTITDPDNLAAQDFLRQLTGFSIDLIITTLTSMMTATNKIFLTSDKTTKAMGAFAAEKRQGVMVPESEIRVEDENAPTIKLVNYILSQGINMGASDIHVESFPSKALLRYRIDGILHEFPPPPLPMYKALVSRIKIISSLDVSERRLPQDGRASFRSGGKEYDLRVSIIPNIHGEGVVIRILDTQGKGKELLELGFSPYLRQRYEALIKKPYGILLVTGPTGSGKTTTLYATLKHIYTPRKKIITIEDPVEYKLDGITQIQINMAIDFTFAAALRSILRHDPDVILLGEIRDRDSADIAIRSSLTGHLVFSTLHTNDSVSALTRLIDMGVPPFLVFASLLGAIAQRLIRLLCAECKKPFEITAADCAALGIDPPPAGTRLFQPYGCPACNNLGYKGRSAVYELFEVTPKMRTIPQGEVTADAIRVLLEGTNFVSLRKSALDKFLSGQTGIEEVLSLTTTEW